MKNLFIIIGTFLFMFLTSLLFEWSFIYENKVRYGIVTLIIICEFIYGFNLLRTSINNSQNIETDT